MSLDVCKLLEDHKVSYILTGSELGRGWVGLSCPFCSDTKHHMGYNEKIDMFTCWRCGIKNKIQTIKFLLDVSYDKAKKLAKRYYIAGSENYESRKRAKEVILPGNHGKLIKEHRQYLKSRGFDPKELEKKWSLVSAYDSSTFGGRILIPIHHQGGLVSYHSRDTTGKKLVKAKACPAEEEVIGHKNTLYGLDRCNSNSVIVSEGPFDIYRWGSDAVATFGTKVSQSQIDMLRAFKNIAIVFDGGVKETEAQKQAERLADKIGVFQNTWVIDIGCDPADLSQKKANKIKCKILKTIQGH